MRSVAEVISSNIKRFMEKKGFTQTQLAKDSGIAQAQMSRYVTGAVAPSLETLEGIAKALGVGIDEMVSNPYASPRGPTGEELIFNLLPAFDLEPKRKAIIVLALTAKPEDIDIMHDTVLSDWLEGAESSASDHKKPFVG